MSLERPTIPVIPADGEPISWAARHPTRWRPRPPQTRPAGRDWRYTATDLWCAVMLALPLGVALGLTEPTPSWPVRIIAPPLMVWGLYHLRRFVHWHIGQRLAAEAALGWLHREGNTLVFSDGFREERVNLEEIEAIEYTDNQPHRLPLVFTFRVSRDTTFGREIAVLLQANTWLPAYPEVLLGGDTAAAFRLQQDWGFRDGDGRRPPPIGDRTTLTPPSG